jgi:hypothetical protein
VKDNGEADVDCGGPCPTKCATNKACNVNADCADFICAGGTCTAPSCTDLVKNGTETDVDCGGSCPPCADEKHCVANADCVNGRCYGYLPGTCVSCMDGVKDGNETDVDCGGDCDLKGMLCAVGQSCAFGFDCITHDCQNGSCVKKPDGQPCVNAVECANGHCVMSEICCHTACTAQAPSTCGANGLCADDGSACKLYAAGVGCGTPACAGGMLTTSACDGAGNCKVGSPSACPGKFACVSATACGTTCASDVDCVTGAHCSTSAHTCI